MDEMATMQQCVTKMKEQDMELNPETCKFVRKTKGKSKGKSKPPPPKKPKFQPRPIVMQTQKPILKTGEFFEQKQPSGLNAELAEIVPAVKFDRKKYKNTQKFDNPHDDFVDRKRTPAQLQKEQKNYLITSKLQPTNHPEMEGEDFLANLRNDNKRYNQTRWTRGPAVVRSSVNLTRAKRAKELGKKYNLQEIVTSNRIKEQRQHMKEQQLQAQGKTKIQARRNAEATAKARAKIAQPVNVKAPVKKTRQRKQNSPEPNTNKVKTRFQARKAAAIRLKELERVTQLAELKSKENRLEDEGDLLAQELKYNSNSGSNANLRPNSDERWNEFEKQREIERHMAR
jgi:hypothetical protein